MYDILSHHPDMMGYRSFTNIGTLEEAKQKRISGFDLVVYSDTDRVVADNSWLFDWETGFHYYAYGAVIGARYDSLIISSV